MFHHLQVMINDDSFLMVLICFNRQITNFLLHAKLNKNIFLVFLCCCSFKLVHLSQEKLFSSKNRTEASLGKKLKIDMLPEIEKDHKVLKAVGFQNLLNLIGCLS